MSFIELEIKEIPQNTTPSRKRKRDCDKTTTAASNSNAETTTTCFTNAGFSSTPKTISCKRRKPKILSENGAFVENSYLEVKSIADIANKAKLEAPPTTNNPYEIIRKPPKKKKRKADIEDACFENPALNLEVPDKQFNPFEVVRSEQTITPVKTKKCFINAALNIRGQDVSAACNPYEVPRELPAVVENEALEEAEAEALPCGLEIGLPFTPTLGCRIDFQNMSLSQLTPSRLLAEKLVFSPVPRAKRSLDTISEESTKDISKELDCYQLELENSINEAKLRKNLQAAQDTELKVVSKLENIAESAEEAAEAQLPEENNSNLLTESIEITVEETEVITKYVETVEHTKEADIAYASDSENEDLDFKAPTPFVRAYRRADTQKHNVSKESLNSQKSTESSEANKHLNVKQLIRKSIRKLLHHQKDAETETEEKTEKKPNIINSIRQSLRRKPKQQSEQLIEEYHEANFLEDDLKPAEMSIIDTGDRTIKLKSNLLQTEYAKVEQLTLEHKHTLRHSLRRSTRCLGQQLMKNVFHKEQEKYAFSK